MCVLWNTTSFVNMVADTCMLPAGMRMAFGVFSAFSTPICYSMIADLFPPDKRTFANALFTSSSFLGIALSSLANNLVGIVGWRETYGICGVYGFIAPFLVLVFVKGPERGRYDPNKQTVKKQLEELEAQAEREIAE